MDDTDRIVAAIFTAAMCAGKAGDFADYFKAYDAFLALAKERAKSQAAGKLVLSHPLGRTS